MSDIEKCIRNMIKAYKGDELIEVLTRLVNDVSAVLRDDIAIAAMQGILMTSQGVMPISGNSYFDNKALSKEAYLIADAMLEQRNKGSDDE